MGLCCRLNWAHATSRVRSVWLPKAIKFELLCRFVLAVFGVVCIIWINIVSWCFEPSQPQRVTLGLNTNFNLSPIHSFHKSLYHKYFFSSNDSSNSIHNFGTQNQKNNNTCFGACLYSVSTQHGNLHPAGWPILFCGPSQELVLATAKRKKSGEVLEKMQVNGPEG